MVLIDMRVEAPAFEQTEESIGESGDGFQPSAGRRCGICGEPVSGRRRWCSNAHKMRAYRQRLKAQKQAESTGA